METDSPSHVRDLTSVRPRIRSSIRFLFQEFGGDRCCVIEDSVTSKFHRIGLPEYRFLRHLDGRNTFSEAFALASLESGQDALTEREAISVLSWLVDSHLADLGGDVPEDVLLKLRGGRMGGAVKNVFNILFVRVPLGSPEELLNRVYPYFRYLCTWVFFALWSVLVGLGVSQVLIHWDRFSAGTEGIFSRDNWFWLICVWLGLKLWHEFWHGLTCKHYGGAVREAGVLLVLFAPLGYVDATSSLAFSSKWQRIRVALAGIYGEFFLAAIGALVWANTGPGLGNTIALNTMIMASTVTLLFNLNPLMRFDGYYVLVDLIEIPNLSTKSSQLLKNLCKAWLLGVTTIRMPEWNKRETWIMLVYGIASFFWRILIMVSLTIAASFLFKGGGLIFASMALLFWLVPMITGLFKYLREGSGQEMPRRGVAFVRLSLLALVIAGVLFIPLRVEVQTPGVVRFSEEQIFRAEAPGFLDLLEVADGDQVEAGALLARLSNPKLEAGFAKLGVDVKRQEIRRRWSLIRQSPAQFEAEQAQLFSLQKQLSEQMEFVETLSFHALLSGRVVAPGIEQREGQFLSAGAEIMRIVADQSLEIVVAVGQTDIDYFRRHLEDPVEVFFRGRSEEGSGLLARIDGRAVRTIDYPTLSAQGGGRLAVKAKGTSSGDGRDAQYELVEPVFWAKVSLPNLNLGDLRPGEQVEVKFRSERVQTVGSRIYGRIWNFIDRIFSRTAAAAQL